VLELALIDDRHRHELAVGVLADPAGVVRGRDLDGAGLVQQLAR
jgi:hypothetical protein